MRAGLYVRVSTAEQRDEGYSVGAQTERLTAYCQAKGWTVHHVYTDPGFSGSNTERPALSQLMKDIKNGKLDIVLVYKLDRLSRSQKDTLFLIEDVFLKNKVEFVSMNENFDTSTAFGRAMIGILSVFAQLEREQIKERTSMGRVERAKDGYFHGGGFDPIGYDYVDGHLVINDYEAMQVKEIYKMFMAGTPITRMRSIMERKYTNKHGSWRSDSSIRSVIRSRIYTGKIYYLGQLYEGRHDAIIDEETYLKAQKRYDDISWTKNAGDHKHRPFKAKHLLTGLLFCGNCGSRYFGKGNYSGHGDKKVYRPYYICYSRAKTQKKMVIDPDCKNKSYAVVALDETVSTEIKKLAFDPVYFDQIIEQGQPVQEDNTSILESRIVELDKQMARVLDLYQLGNIAMDQISIRVDALNREKQSLVDQLENEEVHIPEITIDQANELLDKASDILNTGNLEERRELVHSLIDHIDLVDEDIVIHWAFV